jgi:hypothetical protein
VCSTLSKSHTILLSFQRKSKDDAGVDAFFWPTMPWNAVMGRVDMKNSKSTVYRPVTAGISVHDLTNCTLYALYNYLCMTIVASRC